MCKSCQNPVSPTYFFCPYCGRKLRQPPLSTSVGKQIGIYLLAVFFPFFSIIPGIRYIRQSDSISKSVGIVTLLLSGIFLMLNIYFFYVSMDYFKQLLNSPLLIDTGTINTGSIDSVLMETLKGLQ